MKIIDATDPSNKFYYEMMEICPNCTSKVIIQFSKRERIRSMHRCPNCGVLVSFSLETDSGSRLLLPAFQFCCPECNEFTPQPVGTYVQNNGEAKLIVCPTCQKRKSNDDNNNNQLPLPY